MVRTRYAPSPTGFLHIGGLRTALYSYLFARQHKGKHILRIEDTDQKREVEGSTENLIKSLAWGGVEFDEGPHLGGDYGPYIQSQRTEIYKKYAMQLLESYKAYPCFCTPERLQQMREEQQVKKLPPMYDKTCRRISTEEMKEKLAAGVPYVVRQKMPEDLELAEFHDLIRGDLEFKIALLDDHVLMKSDGFPTYHLANVVDDHLMEITHVIRGEEWLPSAPKHVLLYQAFGWKAPEFAHLPLILNKDRSKLSKRQGDVAVEDYMKAGYTPEAVVNFIALLCWHPGEGETQEIFSMDELIERFHIEKIHKGGAVFDREKLDWIQWQWRRRKFEEDPRQEGEKLVALVQEYIPDEWRTDRLYLERALKTVKEKILQKPQEVRGHIEFYFKENVDVNPELLTHQKLKVDMEVAARSLRAAHDALEKFDDYEYEEKIKDCLSGVVSELGVKNGQVFWPVRSALTGEQFSPGVFEVIWVLGKEKTLQRLQEALAKIS